MGSLRETILASMKGPRGHKLWPAGQTRPTACSVQSPGLAAVPRSTRLCFHTPQLSSHCTDHLAHKPKAPPTWVLYRNYSPALSWLLPAPSTSGPAGVATQASAPRHHLCPVPTPYGVHTGFIAGHPPFAHKPPLVQNEHLLPASTRPVVSAQNFARPV